MGGLLYNFFVIFVGVNRIFGTGIWGGGDFGGSTFQWRYTKSTTKYKFLLVLCSDFLWCGVVLMGVTLFRCRIVSLLTCGFGG